jgi:hypothetical protein
VTAQLLHLISVLRGRVPCHVCCTTCGRDRTEVSHAEAGVLVAGKGLPCPCGGIQRRVHPALSGGAR